MQIQPPRSVPNHVVHLLRHAEYQLDDTDEGGPLTALGRDQASAAAEYLRHWPIARIWSSDRPRALETAAIIGGYIGVGPVRRNLSLREILPTPVPGRRVSLATRRRGRRALDELVAQYLKPRREARHELLVCHGNLIRAIVCRVLGCPAKGWLNMNIHHCALTTITVYSGGEQRLVRYGETAFLPAQLMTGP